MNGYLLDSHVFLWWLDSPRRLSKPARDLLTDGNNRMLVSAVTVWELGIKRSLGRLTFPGDFDASITEAGMDELAISVQHAKISERLPWHHRDPFDRMLVAQAMHEQLVLITSDSNLQRYNVAMVPA